MLEQENDAADAHIPGDSLKGGRRRPLGRQLTC